MPPLPRDIQLIDKYIDGRASAADLAELDRRLVAERGVADVFAAISRMDAWLALHFRQEKDVRNIGEILQAVEAAQPAAGARPGAASRWRSLWPWAAAAAAIVALIGGIAAWLYVSGPAATLNEVLDGRVLVAGAEVTRIPDGAKVSVPESGPAAIRLTDGSRATFDASSEAVLHGRSAAQQQLVELVAGGGTFQVVKGAGRFEVKTALGRVTALGTEFSVRLLATEGRGKDGKEERPLPGRTSMAVAVMSGTVRVEFGGEMHVLVAGQNRRFVSGGERKSKEIVYRGELTSVEAGSISLAIKKGENRAAETRTIAVDGGTKVLVETDEMESVPGEGGKMREKLKMAEGALADLKIGQQVSVSCGEEGARATKVFIHRSAPPRPVKEKERNG